MIRSRLSAAFALLLAIAAPLATSAQPVAQEHITLELVPEAEIAPGGSTHVALHQVIEEEWHTYWRNPGDAGGPTQITWTLPEGWSAGGIIWPTPERLPYGPLMNYGYSDEVMLPVEITAPADAPPGPVTIPAVVDYQVCSDVCIPGFAEMSVTLTVSETPSGNGDIGAQIAEAVQNAPRPAAFEATANEQGDKLRLSVVGEPLAGADLSEAYFFPFDGLALMHAEPQPIERGPEGLTLTLTTYEPSLPLEGVLSLGDRAWQISAESGRVLAAATGEGLLPAAPMPGEAADMASVPPGGGGATTLLFMAAAAFIGGLILNLMPCVFPVISMKAASLASHVHDARAARLQGLAYLAGVLATFLVLAAALVAVRAAGSSVGWGFQLQSPWVTAGLSLLMLLVALNLSGVFEIGTSVQGAGSGLTRMSGLSGAFFTGALAVVVAAPCTAPFMGPALAYALAQPMIAAFVVFGGLGLGFALPLVLFTFIPALLRLVPKPGAWMNTFKTVLSFPMYATAAWLAWVYTGQAGQIALAGLLAAAVLVAFGAWLFGRGQGAASIPRRFAMQAALPLAIVLGAVAINAVNREPAVAREAWSPERVAELRAEGRVVFVDFTADWCVTCKVNETTSLSSRAVGQAFERAGASYLVADWTNRDDQIAAALAEYDRVGVPLYLVYGPEGEPQVLPQLLTTGIVRDALERASAG